MKGGQVNHGLCIVSDSYGGLSEGRGGVGGW